uniref:Uncharacterized protein n=1 Tax=Amphimedon queenslandica TaxID=400682 RepID=A0A1X7V740_AMPQE
IGRTYRRNYHVWQASVTESTETSGSSGTQRLIRTACKALLTTAHSDGIFKILLAQFIDHHINNFNL